MAFHWRADDGRPKIECWLGSFVNFQGIRTSIAQKPYIFVKVENIANAILLTCIINNNWSLNQFLAVLRGLTVINLLKSFFLVMRPIWILIFCYIINPFITPSTNVLGFYVICQTNDQSVAVIMVHETLFHLSKFNKLQTF